MIAGNASTAPSIAAPSIAAPAADDAAASASKRKRKRKRRAFIAGAIAVAGAATFVLMPERAVVDLGVVDRGLLTSTLDEEGHTRMERRVVVSAPSDGNLLPPPLDAGDPVAAGDEVGLLEPVPAPLLDSAARAQLVAAAEAAGAGAAQARANVRRAEETLANARRHLARQESLAAAGAISRVELDEARTQALTLEEELASARAGERVAAEQHAAERAALRRAIGRGRRVPVAVTSPMPGVILEELREDGGIVAAGTPLVEIGDPASLHVVVPVLTEDAADMKPGARVFLDVEAGSAATSGSEDIELQGHVRIVEPKATTKISALGVEEQRVDVIVDLDEPPPPMLGDAFTVQARIVRWQGDVVRVPAGALFRRGEGWAVWLDDEGRAVERDVVVGHRAGQFAEVRSGLVPGDRVVLYPSDAVKKGARLEERQAAPR